MQSKMLAGSSRGEVSVGFHEVQLSSALDLTRGRERCWRVVLCFVTALSEQLFQTQVHSYSALTVKE